MNASFYQSEPSDFMFEAARILRSFADTYGMRRGLFIASEAAGLRPGRARRLLYQEARRIEAHELLRLRAAALELDLHRLRTLEAETAALRARLGLERP